jgi:anti-anti-sigma factor
MVTNIQELEEKFIITLSGELDTAAALELEQSLQPIYTSTGRDILIDCSDLDYIASSGLRIFLSILKKTKAEGKTLKLKQVNDEIKNIFRVTGFLPIFTIED